MSVITPVTSAPAPLEHDKSPLEKPPKVDFPYPDFEDASNNNNRPPTRERIDSETTLTEEGQGKHDGSDDSSRNRSKTVQATQPERPVHVFRKYDTEIASHVGSRPLMTRNDRHSTGGRPLGGPLVQPNSNDQNDDTSETSSSEDVDDLEEVKSSPNHHDLSKARLNQVRSRPRRDKFSIGNENFKTRGKVAKDGRLNISLNEKANSGYLAKALGATLQSHLQPSAKQAEADAQEVKRQFAANKDVHVIPRLNIVIMVIGSRGDIQPFLKIGRILQDKYGHKVRIATHPTFRKFVEDEVGLEFFSVGGDPSELMAFMVKNPGLIPSFETLKAGEIGRRREQMFEMFQGFWRACINTTDDERDTTNLRMLGSKFPFVADAIIANPPSFAHFHCAEKLGIPVHLVFTFPYSPTSAFPHPLANIKASNVDREYTNFMSYPLVELMTWQGLGDLVNRFRVGTLGLEPVSTLWAPGQASRLKIPTTYLWSPGLVPKPSDWGPEIDIAGYVFLDLAASYKPPQDLDDFLNRSNDDRPLLYIGFGSISGIDDPTAFCQMIFDAVAKANVRAVISRGWGGMGDGLEKPDGVFLLDNVPHDWLFPKVDAVVHHGGAGTTAAGLKFGKPTMIVPFFGDQPFWAAMVARAGAGAKEALPLKKLDADKFAEGIRQCLDPEAKQKAQEIAKSIDEEGDGAENAVDSFHRALPLHGKHSMRCGIFDDRVAVWKVKHTGMQLSAVAADLLVENKQIKWSDLELIRHKDWTDFQGPGEPITGVGGVIMGSFQEAVHGLSSISEMTKRDMRRRDRRKRKGKTVADVVAMPGEVASHARAGASRTDTAQPVTQVNLQGEAQPPKLQALLGDKDKQQQARPATMTRTSTTGTTGTEALPTPVFIARDVGKGIGHSTKVMLLMPLEMLTAITLGFRNAPRLYGDRTVRPPPHTITGFRSGWTTAGKELYYGFCDGVIGLVRIPRLDVQAEGYKGLPKGMFRGIGGLVLKPIAGILGVPAYSTKGCVASLRRRLRDTTKTERWIRRARMNQGAKDIHELRKNRAKVRTTNDGRLARQDGDLEDVRTTALTRWTTREQQLLQESREQERSTSLLKSPSRAATS